MDISTILAKLGERFGAAICGGDAEAPNPWVEVRPDAVAEVCGYLRDDAELRFDFLNCITSVDYLQTDPKKAAKTAWQPHLEVLYHLSSLAHKHRLAVKVTLPRWKDGVEGQLPEVPSVSGVWSGALWHEREVYDLGGVQFTGHPDLRRILCPDDWAGHPLRKDYSMPAEYHGIRAR
jgi:NADH-quinone oxidoreductase subunit C